MAESGNRLHTLLIIFFLFLGMGQRLHASHGPAPISDVDHVGIGTFSGSYTHSGTDHVWVIFYAKAGDVISIQAATPG